LIVRQPHIIPLLARAPQQNTHPDNREYHPQDECRQHISRPNVTWWFRVQLFEVPFGNAAVLFIKKRSSKRHETCQPQGDLSNDSAAGAVRLDRFRLRRWNAARTAQARHPYLVTVVANGKTGWWT
jgi:hypothetical protein